MVSSSLSARWSRPGTRRASSVGLLALLGACQVTDPVVVDSTLMPTPAFSTRSPADIAVLPVEDGTPDKAVQRHLVFLRQEVMRQLPDRLFSPMATTVVDTALRAMPAPSAGESLVSPATLQRLAGHSSEDALFALRVERWDESRLLIDRKLRFQFQAALFGSDGQQLWSGSIQGEVKAGGLGAAPRDRDGMARSCGELAVREMMQRLPRRVL